MDLRRFREQVARLLHQGCGDLAVEMGLAIGFGLEGVEDGVLPGPLLNRILGERPRLLLNERKGRSQEVGDVAFLAWLGFQRHVKSELGHHDLLV